MSSDARTPSGGVIDYAASKPRRGDRMNLVVGVLLWVVLAGVVGAYGLIELKPFIDR